ncbi:MAG: GNAT family N-acetyltransferase [Deltaproteobacteria bacterium]|nr:GNAT family N-acetyltransferase [Deltaproteobacteria bacterium]
MSVPAPPVYVHRASAADAGRLAAIHRESIETLGAQAYAPELVAVWARPCVPRRYLDQMERGERYFLALAGATGEEVLGFSSYRLEEGRHRTAVFVAARAARRGVGSTLFRAAEAEARAAGATEVHVDASVGAVGFYRAVGFEELGRGEHRLRDGRGAMACVFMRKRL